MPPGARTQANPPYPVRQARLRDALGDRQALARELVDKHPVLAPVMGVRLDSVEQGGPISQDPGLADPEILPRLHRRGCSPRSVRLARA